MKRLLLLVVLTLMALPGLSAAEVLDCPGCVLGIWDDMALTSNYGTVTTGVMKDIFVGLKMVDPEVGITALEFSVTGMRADTDGIIITGTEWTPMPNVTLGSAIQAPVDVSETSTGMGGQTVAWPVCVAPSPGAANQLTLLRVTFLTFSTLSNKVFAIHRRFPQSNAEYNFKPVLVRCDNPLFTSVRVTTGCYVANWDGTTDPGCDQKTAIQTTTWSKVKRMFD